MTDVRPVWLTREQRDALDIVISALDYSMGTMRELEAAARSTVAAWDDAPDDVASVVARYLAGRFPGAFDNDDVDDFAGAVLSALGRP